MSATTSPAGVESRTVASAAASCLACDGRLTDSLGRLTLRDQHAAYAGGNASLFDRLETTFGHRLDAFEMQRCRACGLEFAAPALAPSPDWYDALYDKLELYPADRWEYAVIAAALAPSDVVIDYGCGSGQFLAALQGKVRGLHGFDFSPQGVQDANRRGLDAQLLQPDGQQRSMSPVEPADHVVAFHVLEHLARPGALFDFARETSRPSAHLWIAVPSDRRASRVYGEADALDSPPHHLSRWTEKALGEAGRRHGWAMQQHCYEPLSTRLAVWEATRRTALYAALDPPGRSLQWAARRGLAAFVWASGRHRRADISGFSMLACFDRMDTR